MKRELLEDDEDVVCVFEGFVYFDDLRVVEGGEDDVFVEEVLWTLEVLLLDLLDGPD